MRWIPLFVLAVGLMSCETDFQLEGEWKDIPVVYAFLSTQDTAHYVRVERAFLEPGGDANAIAQIPDSLYYGADEAVVRLELPNTGASYVLERVDGAQEGYPRETGTFATSPNILYKLRAATADLDGGDLVRIVVDRGGNTEPAEAETVMLENISWSQPTPGVQLRIDDYIRFTNFVWRAEDDAVQVFDLRLIFRYRETDPNDPSQLLDKEVVWVLGEAIPRDESVSLQSFRLRHEDIYQFIGSTLEPLETGIRRFTAIDFQVTGVGRELADYLAIANANIGITSSQAIPRYTNVDQGLGFVSSRYQLRVTDFNLNNPSRDSLNNGVYTDDLNFVP